MRLRWNLSKWKYQATALQERKLARDLAPSQDEASPVLEQKPRELSLRSSHIVLFFSSGKVTGKFTDFPTWRN